MDTASREDIIRHHRKMEIGVVMGINVFRYCFSFSVALSLKLIEQNLMMASVCKMSKRTYIEQVER